MNYDVAIVGAGIVGAACARTLALAGLRVVIIDRAIGGGATAAGMGHITVMDDSEAQFVLTRYSQSLWTQLSPELPADVEFVTTGTLWVAADDEEMAAVQQKHSYYQARGVVTEVLDGNQVARCEPNLRPGFAGGLRVPGESVIYPPLAAVWLIKQALACSADVRLGVTVLHCENTTLHLSDGSAVTCGAIVHATGVGADALAPGVPIRPRKGHLVITDRYPGFARQQIVELGYLKSAHGSDRDSVAFNLQPRKTGQMLLGSSRQYDTTDPSIEPVMLRRMINRALEYMPSLRGLSAIRTWTGFRAATPDSLPLIGPTAKPGHFLATGHEGLGITTALGTADLIVSHLTGRPFAIAPEPYLPTRFARSASHG